MVEFQPDVGRNRLVIRFSGEVQPHHAAAAEAQLHDALARLRSPVDVLSDIRELTVIDHGLLEDFKRIGHVIGKFGTRRVVRVVGKSAQAAVHLARLSKHLKNHEAHLAYSLEEAEQVFLAR